MKLTKSFPVLTLVAGLCSWAPAGAQDHDHGEGHSHGMAESHGGVVSMTEEFHIETVFHRDAVFIHLYDRDQDPIDPSRVRGRIEVRFIDRDRPHLKSTLGYVPGGHGQPGYLSAAIDLSGVLEDQAKADVSLDGLPGRAGERLEYTAIFRLARQIAWTCSMHPQILAPEPGKCPTCHMDLVRQKFTYACPKHPEATSDDPGTNCWICQRRVEKRIDEDGAGEGRDAPGHGGGQGHDHGHGHDHDHE